MLVFYINCEHRILYKIVVAKLITDGFLASYSLLHIFCRLLNNRKTKIQNHHFLLVNFPKHPFKHDLMHVLANGMYVAQYQM